MCMYDVIKDFLGFFFSKDSAMVYKATIMKIVGSFLFIAAAFIANISWMPWKDVEIVNAILSIRFLSYVSTNFAAYALLIIALAIPFISRFLYRQSAKYELERNNEMKNNILVINDFIYVVFSFSFLVLAFITFMDSLYAGTSPHIIFVVISIIYIVVYIGSKLYYDNLAQENAKDKNLQSSNQ